MRACSPSLFRAGVLVSAGTVGCLAWFAIAVDARIFSGPALVLTVAMMATNLVSVRCRDDLWLSASFTCSIVTIALLGPAVAFAAVALAELGAWLVERFRVKALLINVLATGLPNLLAGTLLERLATSGRSVAFAAALAGVSALALALNFVIVAMLTAPAGPRALRRALRPPRSLTPTLLWSGAAAVVVSLTVHSASVEVALAVFLLTMIGSIYMAQIVALRQSRESETRTRNADLIEALMHSLEQRDPAVARHSAAVARFARDIARASGLPDAVCTDAHTAGLVHDVGLTCVSDDVLEHGAELQACQWREVRRHPWVGAEIVRPLGAVADAVACHHERLDGRGYPRGLAGDAIPTLARIVAVAEVYDSLTAGDDCRDACSPLRALLELRRVTGTQLDRRYVEALATVLTGRPNAQRLGHDADLSAALDAERRRLAGSVT